jgi:hypothetical protein
MEDQLSREGIKPPEVDLKHLEEEGRGDPDLEQLYKEMVEYFTCT